MSSPTTASAKARAANNARGPLRVLFINDTSRNGGPGKTLLDILKFLEPARIHRTVLLPRPGVVSERLLEGGAADELVFEPGIIENIFEPLSRPMERGDFAASWPLRLLRACGNAARAMAALVRLTRRVKRERYDAIFCNGTMANFIGGLLAAFTGTPVIWHVLYTLVGPAIRGLHARLAAGRNVRAIVCVSRPTARQFAACRHKVHLIHDALDIAEFDARATEPVLREELTIAQDAVVFGSHGRILPRKGYAEFVRAARLVVDGLNDTERACCRFVVVGDTPQDVATDHLQECRALVHTLGLADWVQFIGFRPAVMSYVAGFDVAIVPSIYDDPLPLAVLEAMALSKPVVAFDVGGMSEMIENGTTGTLAAGSPPDIAGLAQACLAYFRDPGLRQRHGAAARLRIEREFDAKAHARAIQDLLFSVTGTDS